MIWFCHDGIWFLLGMDLWILLLFGMDIHVSKGICIYILFSMNVPFLLSIGFTVYWKMHMAKNMVVKFCNQ